ncbi:tautomerase family protein [Streptomyces cirratus]|uniref:tautomerase family protein n=1 Tax=Streptomyces cirratus TaxID=68187 RepID=UPI0036148FD1
MRHALKRIDLLRGRSRENIRAIADAVQQSLIHRLRRRPGLPAPPGTVIVHVFTRRGPSTEDKQRVYHTLAKQLAEAGVDGKDLFVSYFENGPEDWSFADGRALYVEGDLPVPGR